MSLSSAKGWETSPLCVLSHSLRHKQQSQGTGRIFKLVHQTTITTHIRLQAREKAICLLLILGKSHLFFPSPFHFLHGLVWCPVDQQEVERTPERLSVQMAPAVPEVSLFGRLFHIAWVLPRFIPLAFMKWFSNKTAFKH